MDATGPPSQVPGHGLIMEFSHLWDANSINGSTILKPSQQHTIHILATFMSTVSLVAAICAMYWFIIMRRNFRRDLVLMLIAGGFWKSLWFFIFSVATFIRGQVKTESMFCQASGYLLQVGFEACDVAVLFMSMHMYYQIFPPARSKLGHEGLYRVRHAVLAAWIIFPNFDAALAFVNPHAGYMAQGAFCSMPLRPFYYRLGLFWAPRYLIWLYIVFVAIKIYRHVGTEFKIFGQEKASDTSVKTTSQSPVHPVTEAEELHTLKDGRSNQWISAGPQSRKTSIGNIGVRDDMGLDLFLQVSPKTSPRGSRRTSNTLLPEYVGRRHSAPNWRTSLHDFGFETTLAAPMNPSTHAFYQESDPVAPIDGFVQTAIPRIEQHRGSVASISTRQSSVEIPAIPTLARIDERPCVSMDAPLSSHNSAEDAVMQRRRAIQRQLRLLFIYPVVYMMLWVIPFVVNVMNYTDYYAQHPIFALQVLQVFMLTAMTHVDVVVFCWRERPWRHIPGSDGTFVGSFMWWRYCFKESWIQGRRVSRVLSTVPEDETHPPSASQTAPRLWASLHSSIFRNFPSSRNSQVSSNTPASPRSIIRHRRTLSGGNDRNVLEAERAYERLALERADYQQNRQSLQDTRASVISTHSPSTSKPKEWFDKELNSDLFSDHDCSPAKGVEKSDKLNTN